MLAALQASGWRNYSLFASATGTIVGYYEADDVDAARRALAQCDANSIWQAEMSRFFVGLDGQRADEVDPLEEIFNLDAQMSGP